MGSICFVIWQNLIIFGECPKSLTQNILIFFSFKLSLNIMPLSTFFFPTPTEIVDSTANLGSGERVNVLTILLSASYFISPLYLISPNYSVSVMKTNFDGKWHAKGCVYERELIFSLRRSTPYQIWNICPVVENNLNWFITPLSLEYSYTHL